MNYLCENAGWFIKDTEVVLTMLVEDGHIIFFHSKPKGISTSLLEGCAGVAGVLLAPVSIVVGGSMLLASLTAEAMRSKPNLATSLANIKQRGQLTDEDIFISNPDQCIVVLSGKSSFFGASTCDITISGQFVAGAKTIKGKIETCFENSPSTVAKIFGKGKIPVTLNPT